MKQCARCKEVKEPEAFGKHCRKPDGLYNYCKACTSQITKADYIRRGAVIRQRETDRRRRPENVEKIREQKKRAYWANRDSELEHAKAWARNNRERRRAYVREWNAKNREQVRSYQKNYKAKKRSTGRAAVTLAAWKLIKQAFRNKCVYCGRHMERLEQDHVIPLSRGGEHLPHNIVPACRHCNATKLYNEPPPFWWTVNAS